MGFVRPIVDDHVAQLAADFASLAHRGRAVHKRPHAQHGSFPECEGAADAASFHDLAVRAQDHRPLLRVQRRIPENGPRSNQHLIHGTVNHDALGQP